MSETTARNPIVNFLAGLGALRIMLGVLAIILMIFAPDPDVPTQRSGWGLFVTGVLPAVGPVVFMVLLLDAIMSRVLMIDKEGAERARYKRALWFNLAMAGLMLLSWLPMLMYLADQA